MQCMRSWSVNLVKLLLSATGSIYLYQFLPVLHSPIPIDLTQQILKKQVTLYTRTLFVVGLPVLINMVAIGQEMVREKKFFKVRKKLKF